MKLRYYTLTAVLALVTLSVAFWLYGPPPAQAQTNLLTNGGFEQGYYNQDGIPEIAVPTGWRMHWLDGQAFAGSNGPAYRPETVVWNIVDAPPTEKTLFFRDGSYALKIFKGWSPVYAALSQDVSGLEVGRRYRLAIPIFIDIVETYDGGKQAPSKLDSGQVRLGASTVGVGWRDEANIQYSPWWTAGNIQPFYLAYPVFLYDFTATATDMTVWVEMASKDPYINNGFFLDGLALVALDERDNSVTAPSGSSGGAAAQPAGPTATPQPTPTPRADGAVVHIVQAGDSIWGLAIQYAGVMGLTPEEARTAIPELNNNPTFINPGDELIIVPPNSNSGNAAEETPPEEGAESEEEPPTATEEATPEPTAEPEDAAEPANEEETVSGETAVNAITNINTTNGICVSAYEDLNADGQRDFDAEPLLENVAITVFQGGRTVASYVTDVANDLYCFENLAEDTYQVQAFPAAGYRTTTPESWAVAVSSGVIIPVTFGITATGPEAVADTSAAADISAADTDAAPAENEETTAVAETEAADNSGGFLANMSGIILIVAAVLVMMAGIGVYLLRRG